MEDLTKTVKVLEDRCVELYEEIEMFKVYLKEAALTHAYESFKGEYRRRLAQKAQAEANKAKMKEANDKASEELTECKPGIQLRDGKLSAEDTINDEEFEASLGESEDDDEFTDSEPTTVEVEEEALEESDELEEGDSNG